MSTDGSPGHAGAAEELRALAVALLDRVEPLLERARTGPPAAGPGAGEDAPCTACPVCALVAVLRGEHPELAARLAEQAAGLVAVLRAALDEGAGVPPPPDPDPQPEAAPARPVQHIAVEIAVDRGAEPA
ncbi:MAG TPA: hypothetical protein VD813_12375 [Pseudonocardia sp.]|nr:hypothetical protein [Pseudonocardia sp.]